MLYCALACSNLQQKKQTNIQENNFHTVALIHIMWEISEIISG